MYLLDVGFSFSAMPCLGLCVTASLGAVGASTGLGVSGRLSHGVEEVAKNVWRREEGMTGMYDVMFWLREGRMEGGDWRGSEKGGKGGIL